MNTVTIYGSSDDLIEVEGAIREEFYLESEGTSYIGFSDGTVLSIEYTDKGIWRIYREHTGSALFEKTEAIDSESEYSDRVTLTGDIRWIVGGGVMAKAK